MEIFRIALLTWSATYTTSPPTYTHTPRGFLKRANVPIPLLVADPEATVGYEPAMVTTSIVDVNIMRIALL